MYGNDHLGLRSDLLSNVLRIHIDGSGINVSENKLCSYCERICHCSNEGDCGNDNLVAFLKVGILVSDLKACGSVDNEG